MSAPKSKAAKYTDGFTAGFTSREYCIWETKKWREGWLQGTCSRVGYSNRIREAIASMGLKSDGVKEG